MTLIVASLYLPYKPQFELDNIENIAKDLLKYNSIKIENENLSTNYNVGTKSIVSPSDTPFKGHNISQDSLVLNKGYFKRIKSSNALDKLMSSEQFMENLTANVQTTMGTPPYLNIKNHSVENLFGSGSNLSTKRATSPTYSLPIKLNRKKNFDDPTEILLKNVNKSLIKQKMITRPNNLKRLNSNLKYSTTVNDNDSKNNLSNPVYNVPDFGGFSNQDKQLKAKILRSSQELFKNLPWSLVNNDLKGNGSLKNAIKSCITQSSTENFHGDPLSNHVSWIGTMGIATDEIPVKVINDITESLQDDCNCFPVITDDETFLGSYRNFCKQILWPTLHYQIPDSLNSKAFEDHSWNFYHKLNKQFANKIIENYKTGDTIWIHDYHLMLVPRLIRDKLPYAKIGFFLHISFPSSEVFRCLAHREEILDGLLGANFVGFQTKEYLKHFIQTCNRLLMADASINNNVLEYRGNMIKISNIPIGIDAIDLQLQLFKNENIAEWRGLIRQRWGETKLIVSKDHIDRIRGLVQKLSAFEKFLLDNPSYIGKVSLIQICIDISGDDNLKRQLTLITDRINELTGTISDTPPVVFLYQDLEFEQYLALNCEADLFWVNSQREGMNLSCHEFIASSLEKKAPLLLSEFTGSASELYEGSLIINPWDIKQVSETIKKGLELSTVEKYSNWKLLLKKIIINDSDNWIKINLRAINISWKSIRERSTVFKLNLNQLNDDFKKSEKRFILLKMSEPPSSRTILILNELMLKKKNIVFIMNSFSKSVLEILYNRLPYVGLLAENGAYVRLNNTWYSMVDKIEWKSEVIKIFDDKMERLPGSYYKISDSLIAFHAENADDKDRVSNTIGDAMTNINTMYNEKNIHAYVHNDVLYVQQNGLSIQAMQFLFNYFDSIDLNNYDNENKNSISNDLFRLFSPKSDNVNKVKDNSNDEKNNKSQVPIDFVLVAGSSSPILDPIFNYVNRSVKNESIKFGHTITYGNNNNSTFAKEQVTGLNELFTSLKNLSNL